MLVVSTFDVHQRDVFVAIAGLGIAFWAKKRIVGWTELDGLLRTGMDAGQTVVALTVGCDATRSELVVASRTYLCADATLDAVAFNQKTLAG